MITDDSDRTGVTFGFRPAEFGAPVGPARSRRERRRRVPAIRPWSGADRVAIAATPAAENTESEYATGRSEAAFGTVIEMKNIHF